MIFLPLVVAAAMLDNPVADAAAPAAAAVAPASVEEASPPAPTDGEVVVTARKHVRVDPLEDVNVKSFEVTQKVDEAVVGPLAMTYQRKVPEPIRAGLGNFRYNLQEPIVFANFVLQAKIGKAAETLGRFVINSTLGVGGLFDMAKRRAFKLPRRRNGFGNTLGFYGVGPGVYFFLPLIGPTTARDLVGRLVDNAMLPFTLPKALRNKAFTVPLRLAAALDHRADFDDELQAIKRSADPYVTRREVYLAKRQAEIDHLRGRDRVPVTVIEPKP